MLQNPQLSDEHLLLYLFIIVSALLYFLAEKIYKNLLIIPILPGILLLGHIPCTDVASV